MAHTDIDITIDQRSAVPLYEQVCQQFRHQIESQILAIGAQLPTSQELSEKLCINYRTAHQAMATLAKEGYVTRRAKRGTVVKGIPRRGVVGIYAWIEMFGHQSKHEYYRLIFQHLSRQLEGHGRVHRVYMGSEGLEAPNLACEDLLQHVSSGVLCGVVAVNVFPRIEELVRLGRLKSIPVVALERAGEDDVQYSACPNYVGLVHMAAEYLRRHGRQRVGVIYNRVSRSLGNPQWLVQELARAGCHSDALWIMAEADTENGGHAAASKLPFAELDGLIVTDDVMALGVDRYLSEAKISVPGDLMAATLWNKGSRLRLNLPFERFEFDVEKQARLSLQLMQDAINGRRIAEPHLKLNPIHREL